MEVAALVQIITNDELPKIQPEAGWFEQAEKFKELTIADLDDVEGAKVVHEARMIVKNKRIEIEKLRKELKDFWSLTPGRLIDGEAKRLFSLLEPIESTLEKIENEFVAGRKKRQQDRDNEIERVKQLRIADLVAVGMVIDESVSPRGSQYVHISAQTSISYLEISTMNEGDFNLRLFHIKQINDAFILEVQEKKNQEDKAMADKLDELEKLKSDNEAKDKLIADLQANQKPYVATPTIKLPQADPLEPLRQLRFEIAGIEMPTYPRNSKPARLVAGTRVGLAVLVEKIDAYLADV